MEDLKENIIVQILADVQDTFTIDIHKMQLILDCRLNGCYITQPGTELALSDMSENITFYLATKKVQMLNPTSIKEYEGILNRFNEVVKKPIEFVVANDVRLYFAYIQYEKNLKESTMSSNIEVIKNFFKFFTEEGVIPKNPTVNIKSIKYDKHNLRQPLTPEEVEKLRNACITERERAIFEFLYSTACRVSEVVDAKIEDINWETGSLFVIGKGKKRRKLRFSVKCKVYLKEYLNIRQDDNPYLFVGDKNPHKGLTADGFRYVIKEIAKRTDIKKSIFPHLLRHTRATEAFKIGMELSNIQSMLGHTSVDTTLIYAHKNENDIDNEYQRLIG